MSQDIDIPCSDDISNEQANHLFDNCGFFILEDLPVGSEIGIDLSSFKTGENFKGIKLIPPGLHFIFAGVSDRTGQTQTLRTGFYHQFKRKELVIRRWSVRDEDFDDTFEPTEQLINSYSNNLRQLDKYLGPFQFSSYKTYLGLTHKLDFALAREISPLCGYIRAIPYLINETDPDSGPSSKATTRVPRKTLVCDARLRTEEDLIKNMKQSETTRLRLTQIAKDHSIHSTSELNITQYYLDTTSKLDKTFVGEAGLRRLLGELQFDFVTLLIGQVYECFEHWLDLLRLVCLADEALCKQTGFFIEFTQILSAQLDQVSDDLFENIVDQENNLRYHLDVYFQNISQMKRPTNELEIVANELRGMLETKFGWKFNLELDDEKPVVVEI